MCSYDLLLIGGGRFNIKNGSQRRKEINLPLQSTKKSGTHKTGFFAIHNTHTNYTNFA
jgi:hypothetical protein